MHALRFGFRLLPLFALLFTEQSEGQNDDASSDDDGDGDQNDRQKAESSKEPSFRVPKDQDDLDRMIRNRLKKAREETESAVRAEVKADRERSEAEAKGETEKLLKLEKEARAKAEQERDDERLARLRARVALRHKLPEDLEDVLKGTTEEELTEHAKRLQKHLRAAQEDRDEDSDSVDNDAGVSGTRKQANGKSVPEFRIATPTRTVKIPGS